MEKKSINRRKKGKYFEKKCRDQLKADGYLVDFKPNTRFCSNDFFYLFDVLAIKENEVRLIQVKSNLSHFYTARKEIREWRIKNNIKVQCEVWLAKDKLWRKEIITV